MTHNAHLKDPTPILGSRGKGTPPKRILLVAAIMVAEAAAVAGGFWLIGPPSPTVADQVSFPEINAEDDLVEVLVLQGRLDNNRSGVTHVYPTEIYIQVPQRHVEALSAWIADHQNELRADVSTIWKATSPAHLHEPGLQTLSGRIESSLRNILENAIAGGGTCFEKCIVVAGTGYRIEP
jgi:flagellar basal body-associated protein FliL